jgi:hypothetical protein
MVLELTTQGVVEGQNKGTKSGRAQADGDMERLQMASRMQKNDGMYVRSTDGMYGICIVEEGWLVEGRRSSGSSRLVNERAESSGVRGGGGERRRTRAELGASREKDKGVS